jgi:HEAT repeat protein
MRIYAAWVLLGLTPSQVLIKGAPAPVPMPLHPSAFFDAPDEQVLKDNKLPTDGPGLVEFFRRHIVQTADEARIQNLIRQLGDDDFNRREDASLQLNGLGLRARPFLQKAASDQDAEVAHRAKECLKQVDQGTAVGAVAAGIRVLAKLKPDGAAETLLAYLPSAPEETLAEEVRLALVELAVRDGKTDPTLAVALTDKSALKRAAAAFALGRAKAADQLPAVRKLMQDADPAVCYRAGVALAAAGEKEAVPVLIGLLDRLSSADAGHVEELLYRIADDKAPPPSPPSPRVGGGKGGGGVASRRKVWKAWWDDNGARVDAGRLEDAARTIGYTLVVLLDQGRILELDAANHPRLAIDRLDFPLDAQLLPKDHVLVAEHNGNRVTERDGKNQIVWEKRIEGPLAAQRLANGNTFIATRGQLIEVDGDGKQVSSLERPNGEAIMKAKKLSNGEIALITQLGTTRFVLLEANGNEIRSFNVDLRYSGGRIDLLPNGNLLVPEAGNNRVVELDKLADVVWEVAADQPIAAVRLPNGHTLITSMSEHRAVEVDRDGKEVWQYRQDTRITRAFRR